MASDPPSDTGFMRRAMALAREGDRRPGANPIGCVIVLDGAMDRGAIFFAGEALYAGLEMGTVEAALASGQETAQMILAAGP